MLELWNGIEFSKVRELHSQGLYDQHPMCKICDTWAEDYARKEYVDDKKMCCVVKLPSQTVYSK